MFDVSRFYISFANTLIKIGSSTLNHKFNKSNG